MLICRLQMLSIWSCPKCVVWLSAFEHCIGFVAAIGSAELSSKSYGFITMGPMLNPYLEQWFQHGNVLWQDM